MPTHARTTALPSSSVRRPMAARKAAPAVEPDPPPKRRRANVPSPPEPEPEPLPWEGLSRGGFFRELVQQVLLPQGFTLVELLQWRNGIDVVAHRPQIRWTRWVAQLDVTGEPVAADAIREIVQGRQAYGAHSALLITTGPVSDEIRDVATSLQVEVWDEGWLRAVWHPAAHLDASGRPRGAA